MITPDTLTLADVVALEADGFDPNVPSDYLLGQQCARWRRYGTRDYVSARDICREINARAAQRAQIEEDADGDSNAEGK